MGLFDFAVIAPLTLVILALGVYPQAMLEPSEKATNAHVLPAARVADDGQATAEATP